MKARLLQPVYGQRGPQFFGSKIHRNDSNDTVDLVFVQEDLLDCLHDLIVLLPWYAFALAQ